MKFAWMSFSQILKFYDSENWNIGKIFGWVFQGETDDKKDFFLEQIPKRTSYVVTHSSEQEPVIGQRIQTLYRI